MKKLFFLLFVLTIFSLIGQKVDTSSTKLFIGYNPVSQLFPFKAHNLAIGFQKNSSNYCLEYSYGNSNLSSSADSKITSFQTNSIHLSKLSYAKKSNKWLLKKFHIWSGYELNLYHRKAHLENSRYYKAFSWRTVSTDYLSSDLTIMAASFGVKSTWRRYLGKHFMADLYVSGGIGVTSNKYSNTILIPNGVPGTEGITQRVDGVIPYLDGRFGAKLSWIITMN